MATIEEVSLYSVFRLANLADLPNAILDQDHPEGAAFLRDILDQVVERAEDGSIDDDTAHEVAGSAVPVYSTDVMLTLTYLKAWDEEVEYRVNQWDSILVRAEAALHEVARRLAGALIAELDDDPAED